MLAGNAQMSWQKLELAAVAFNIELHAAGQIQLKKTDKVVPVSREKTRFLQVILGG